MSGSRTIIADDDRLPNVHPGEILREDFLIGSDVAVAEVAVGSGVAVATLDALLRAPIDAEIDLRLARYFGLGFFPGLQHDYELEEARDALSQIAHRAA